MLTNCEYLSNNYRKNAKFYNYKDNWPKVFNNSSNYRPKKAFFGILLLSPYTLAPRVLFLHAFETTSQTHLRCGCHAIDEQDTVEMIGLMLDGPGQQTVGLDD